MSTPRGIRNNNPGNIDFNPRNPWQGQLGMEEGVARPRFARFDQPENGIRALAKLLINYRGKDGMPGLGAKGIDTVLEAISRWAPTSENDTRAYAEAVAQPGRAQHQADRPQAPATARAMVLASSFKRTVTTLTRRR